MVVTILPFTTQTTLLAAAQSSRLGDEISHGVRELAH